MIFSNDCYIFEKCKKCTSGNCTRDGSFCQKLFRVDNLLTKAELSEVQKQPIKLYLDTADEIAYSNLCTISQNIETTVGEGHNLYIYSTMTGNGKTSWAIKLLQDYVNSVWYKKSTDCIALFINVPRYLMSVKSSFDTKSDYVDNITSHVLDCDLVIWDDIGTKCATEFEMERLLSIINTRMDSGKCNIFTSNVAPASLSSIIGQRLTSRILGKSFQIRFVGFDKRINDIGVS